MLGKRTRDCVYVERCLQQCFYFAKIANFFLSFFFFVDYLLSTRQQQQQRQQLSQYKNKKQEKVTTTQFGLLTLCCCSAASLPIPLPLCLTFLISFLIVIVRFALFSCLGVAFVAFCVAGRNGDAVNECTLVHTYVHPFICCIWIYMNVHTYICKHFRVLHEYIIVILDSTIQVCTASINTVLI